MWKRTNSPRGFTLLELVLTIATFAAFAGVSIPLYQSFQVKNDLDVAAYATAHSLRRAQQRSMNMIADDGWGVALTSGAVTVFKGASYAARDTTYDEAFSIADSITLSGTTEFVFATLTGEPSAVGTVTMTSANGSAATITLNEKGVVIY